MTNARILEGGTVAAAIVVVGIAVHVDAVVEFQLIVSDLDRVSAVQGHHIIFGISTRNGGTTRRGLLLSVLSLCW